MDGLTDLQNIIVVLANLLALSMAGGLIFSVLIQPRRESIVYLFTFFCISIGLWALTSLMRVLPSLRFGLPDTQVVYLMATSNALTAISFFIFIVAFARAKGPVIRLLTLCLPVIFVAAIFLVWSGQAFTGIDLEVGLGRIKLTTVGYFVLAMVLIYLIVGLWTIIDSQDKHTRSLLIPSILLILSFASKAFDALVLPVDTLLATVASVWIGWVILYFQLFNPMTELNAEMRVANRDLQQVINDLASEKTRAEELNRELQAANQYKSEFLANMSHELRTPLNSIIGYSELLQSGIYGVLSDKQLDRLEKIHRNGKHLADLINAILDINKIESGKFRLDATLFHLRIVVDDVISDMEPLCTKKNLELIVDIDDNLPPMYGDQNRIRQVLDNLMDNAVKFTNVGQIKLEAFKIIVQDGQSANFQLPLIGWLRDGTWTLIKVTDTGIGISPEDQTRIFGQFSQADSSYTREHDGTGLGLTIAQKLVEMHSGVIWVKSQPGKGSSFFVALPADLRDSDIKGSDNILGGKPVVAP